MATCCIRSESFTLISRDWQTEKPAAVSVDLFDRREASLSALPVLSMNAQPRGKGPLLFWKRNPKALQLGNDPVSIVFARSAREVASDTATILDMQKK